MEKPRVSIIIPAYNEEKLLEACLSSIVANTEAGKAEIILVDNGSCDGTISIAESFPRVKIFEEGKKGVMHARQRGYLESLGDIIVFLDADNIISKDWIEQIEKDFENNPKLVCVSGPYQYYDLALWKQYLMTFYWHTIVYAAYALFGSVGNFGNMAIKREVLQKMEGLDTSIVFYGDDTATARKAAEFGKVKYDLRLSVRSSGRRFAGQGILKTSFMYAVNFCSQSFFKKSVSKSYEEFR